MDALASSVMARSVDCGPRNWTREGTIAPDSYLECGAPGSTRTTDKRIRRPLLYPLSYEGTALILLGMWDQRPAPHPLNVPTNSSVRTQDVGDASRSRLPAMYYWTDLGIARQRSPAGQLDDGRPYLARRRRRDSIGRIVPALPKFSRGVGSPPAPSEHQTGAAEIHDDQVIGVGALRVSARR